MVYRSMTGNDASGTPHRRKTEEAGADETVRDPGPDREEK
jgi:hypothetical protein